jgi:hypothetical protein
MANTAMLYEDLVVHDMERDTKAGSTAMAYEDMKKSRHRRGEGKPVSKGVRLGSKLRTKREEEEEEEVYQRPDAQTEARM